MKKKLRLLITNECNRNCSGCCNKQWDLSKLPICTDYSGYDEILITGGEPMLHPLRVVGIIKQIWKQSTAKIILYTTDLKTAIDTGVLHMLDGITVTLHEKEDIIPFLTAENEFPISKIASPECLSLRLNTFKGVDFPLSKLRNKWRVKYDIEWIENCPLPEGEVFMRTLFSIY